MYLKLVIAALLAAILPVSAFNPGGTMSMDIDTIREAKNTYFAFVLNILNNQVKIPNISFHNGHIDGNTFHVSDSANELTINIDAGNIVQVNIKNLQASFHSNDLAYKVWFITEHGSLDVSMKNVSVQLKLYLETQKLSNGKTVPAFKVTESSVDIPKGDIDFWLHGDVIVQFADLFKGLFMGTVRDQIMSNVQNALNHDIAPAINELIAQQKGETVIWEGLSLDWSIPSAPQVNGQDLELGIKGLFYPSGQSYAGPPVTPPVMPYINHSNPSKVQCYISNYLADSLGYTFVKTIGINFWLDHTLVPSTSPIQLNTASMDAFFPGLAKKYGNNQTVDLHVSLTSLHDFASVEAQQTLSGHANAQLQFWVNTASKNKEKAVALDVTDIYGQFHIDIIEKINIALNVTKASVKEMSVDYSTIGNLTNDVVEIEALVDQILVQALPPINDLLHKSPIRVPNKIFGLFNLTDLSLTNHNGYIEAGLTPHFYPPKEPAHSEPEDIFTKPGTYRYIQMVDKEDNFMMWDTKLNQRVEKVYTPDELEKEFVR